MLTSSQRGCVCTPQDLSAGCISSTIQTHDMATKRYPLRGCGNAFGKTQQAHVGTSDMTQQAFYRVPSDFSSFAVPDSGVNHGKPALETLLCRPHPDTTPKTDTPSCFWSCNRSHLWTDNCSTYLEGEDCTLNPRQTHKINIKKASQVLH